MSDVSYREADADVPAGHIQNAHLECVWVEKRTAFRTMNANYGLGNKFVARYEELERRFVEWPGFREALVGKPFEKATVEDFLKLYAEMAKRFEAEKEPFQVVGSVFAAKKTMVLSKLVLRSGDRNYVLIDNNGWV